MDILDIKKEFSIKKILLLGFGVSVVVTVFWILGYQSGFIDKGLLATSVARTLSLTTSVTSTPSPTPTVTITPISATMKKFEDPYIKGFSFYYESKDWEVSSNEDIKACNDIKCSDPLGRSIVMRNTKYSIDSAKRIELRFSLDNSTDSVSAPSTKKCFDTNYYLSIDDSTWFRTRNPFFNSAYEDTNKTWSRRYYRSEMLDSSYCLKGDLDISAEPTKKLTLSTDKFPDKKVYLTIDLDNTIGFDKVNVADDIVQSVVY